MKYLIKLFIIFTTTIMSFSCSKYLDKVPLESPSNVNFYSSGDEILMAVNACYSYVTYVNYKGSSWPDLPDIFYRDYVTDIAATRLVITLWQDFLKGQLTSSSLLTSSSWSWNYTGIGRVNALLDGMVKAEKNTNIDLFNRIKSEARVIRAICYLNLINDYGDVPFFDKLIDMDKALEIGRTSKREIVEFIYNELDESASYLPLSYGGSDRGRITRGAAHAIKARAALYNKDYNIAKQAAKTVIDLNIYKLHPSYRNLFTYAGEYSQEIILDYQYSNGGRVHNYHGFNAPRNSGGQSQAFPTEDLVASFECVDGLPIDESPLYKPNNPFANRDPRLFGAIILPRVWDGTTVDSYGTVFNGFEYMSSKEKLYSSDGTIMQESLSELEKTVLDTKTNTIKTNQEVTNPYSSFTGYCIYKYMDAANMAAPSAANNNFILCRFAEILLTYAEASIELNEIDQSVLDALNMVRARAYGNTSISGATNIDAVNYPKIYSLNQSELRKIIRRERKVELCFEGFRLDDLKRWGLLSKALNKRITNGRPENYSKLSSLDIPEIDDDGLVILPYANQRYGLTNEVRKLRFWEQLGDIPESYNLLPIPLDQIQLNSNLTQNPGYN